MKVLRIRNKKNVCFVPYANCKQGRDYVVNCVKYRHGEALSYAQTTEVEIEPKMLSSKVIEFGVVVPRLDHLFK